MRLSAAKTLIRTIAREIDSDHLALVSAGVAFFAFLALFPACAALIAIYGLVFDPIHVHEQMNELDNLLPADAHALVAEQLERLAAAGPSTLSLGVAIATIIALWSATKGARGVIEAINLAYDEPEARGFVRRQLVALAMTCGSLVFFVLTVALAAGVPAVLGWAALGDTVRGWIALARWPLLFVVVLVAVSTVYRLAPTKKAAGRRIVSAGSLFATVALLAASIGFSLYVSRFGDYNEIYGSVGAVAVFLLWLYLAAFVVLLGAELDAELARHPELSRPVGPPAPRVAPADRSRVAPQC